MSKTVSFETGHEEMIHDAQLDYYGKRLATCSSDRSIRIFDVHAPSQQTLTSQIRGHEGPVWQVGWAHPKFGSILASCSYDGRVCVWKEQAANNWIKIYEYSRPESASINSLQFAPHSFGLALAVGSADGTVSVLTRKADNTWDVQAFPAHKGGVNSVSWGPDVKSGSLLSQQASGAVKFDRKLLTGGCDNQIRLWRLNEENNTWYELRAFQEVGGETAHSDWVRDAAFAPSLGLPSNTIASASEDKTVSIWVEDPASGAWRKSKTLKFDTKVYRVSWSLMGNILAVAQGDNKVSLWKESIEGDWKNLSQAQAAQIAAAPASAYPGAVAPPSPAHAAPADHYQQQPPQQQQIPQGHYQPQVPQQQQQAPPQMYQQPAPHQYQPQQQQYGMPQQPAQPQYGMPQQGMYGHPQGNPTAF